MKKIVPIMICLFSAIANAADENLLYGQWSGNTPNSRINYDMVTITEDKISWKGNVPHNPECETKYRIVDNYTNKDYEGENPNLKNNITYNDFKLKIVPDGCAKGYGYILFAIPEEYPNESGFSFANIVFFSQSNKPNSWMSFHKSSVRQEIEKDT